jgi:hypothetical protein
MLTGTLITASGLPADRNRQVDHRGVHLRDLCRGHAGTADFMGGIAVGATPFIGMYVLKGIAAARHPRGVRLAFLSRACARSSTRACATAGSRSRPPLAAFVHWVWPA